jgi:hypothetical protein
MSRQTDIKSMVSQLMTVYGKKSSTDEYNHLSHIWEKALAKLNEQEIRVGYQNLIKTRVKSGMPSPAEFYEALYNDISDDALMAWNQLFQALKSHPGRPICFEDTVLAETCRRLGGLPFLGSISATDLSFQKRSFMDTYCILAKQGDMFDPICNGTYEAKPIEMKTLASRKSVTGGAL